MRSGDHAVNSEALQAKPFPVVRFGDFVVNCLSRKDLVQLAIADCERPTSLPARLVFDANGHALSLAKIDATYRRNIAQADIIHADGAFLVTLSRVLRLPRIPERSATTDMIHDFAAAFSGRAGGFYLLGGEERVNAECADALEKEYPELRIAGRQNGFFAEAEEQAVVDSINASGAEILWVGLGKPKEQTFAVRWRAQLKVRWVVTCGGCYNYLTGDYPRAPDWMQRANLEWVHRMATNPRKLWWRYLTTTPHALWIALRENGPG